MKEMKEKIQLREWVVMAVGMFFVAVSVYFIMMPSGFVIGTLSGLVMVLTHFIPLKVSVLTLILNVFLLLLGFIFIGRDFGGKTVITSLLLPLYLRIFEIFAPNPPALTSNSLTNVLCFVVVLSFGQMMLFNINASSGGLDIVAKLMNRYLHMEIGKSLAISGMIVAATSILVYDRETLVLSLLGTWLGGVVLDFFIDGTHIRKRISIVSPHYAEIQSFIIQKLGRGVTLYPVRGGWDNSERTTLVTVLQKNEYAQLLSFVQQTDPCAFVTVSTVGEVIGQWNPHIRRVR